MTSMDEAFVQAERLAEEHWEAMSGYIQKPYYTDMNVQIDASRKAIGDMSQNVSTQGEENSQYIPFIIDRYYDGIDLSEMLFQVEYQLEDGAGSVDNVVNAYKSEDKIKFGWIIPAGATQLGGSIKVMVFCMGRLQNGESYILKTKAATYNIPSTLEIGGSIKPDEQWYLQFVEQMDEKVSIATTAAEQASTAKTDVDALASEVRTNTAEVREAKTTVETDKQIVVAAAERAEQVAQSIPQDYTELSNTVDSHEIHNESGQSLVLDTAEGGIRLNEIVGKTEKDGDEVHSVGDGYACVDLGSATYSYNSEGQFFSTTSISNREFGSELNEYCDGFTNVGDKSTEQMTSVEDWSIAPNNNSVQIKFKCTKYGNDSNAFKNAMYGKMLTYKLAEGASASNYAMVVKEHGNYYDGKVVQGYIGSDGKEQDDSVTLVRSVSYYKCKPNDSVTLSHKWHASNVIWYRKDKTFISRTTSAPFIAPANAEYFRFNIGESSASGIHVNPSNVGDVEVICSSYGKSFPVQLGSTPLCGIGSVEEKVFKQGGKWNRDKKFATVDLGSLNFSYNSSAKVFTCSVNSISPKPKTYANAISPTYTWKTTSTTANKEAYIGSVNLVIYDSAYTDASAFKASLSGKILTYETEAQTTELLPNQIDCNEFEAFNGKTYIETADGLATLDVGYGKSDLSSTALMTALVSKAFKQVSSDVNTLMRLSVKYTSHQVSSTETLNIKGDFVALGIHRGVALAVLQTAATNDNIASMYIVYFNVDNDNCYITPVYEGAGRSPRLSNTYVLSLSTDTTKRYVHIGLQVLFEF